MRNTNTQSDHDRMVKAMAEKLEKEGMRVQADHIGHRNGQPNQVGGHIPNILATSFNKTIIVEAETPDTISLSETREQMQAFSRAQGEFHVIVPKGYIETMKNQAREWGIQIDQYWHMEV